MMRIAVCAGPTATVLNTPPLVTSNQARAKHGLPQRENSGRFDVLRPQRLAAPVKVYIEAYSAHPLEIDGQHLYADPDGYMDEDGNFHTTPTTDDDVPVYEAELRPDDGLFLLPYMARRRDGGAWESECPAPDASECRQTFFPDAERLFEEVDRFGLMDDGWNTSLGSQADFDFFRVLPSGGYTRGSSGAQTSVMTPDDFSEEGLAGEVLGRDFFPYTPRHLAKSPSLYDLAAGTNAVQELVDSCRYQGLIWLEGSPVVDETMYWLNLMIDTAIPLCGVASQRRHDSVGNDGDRNLIDAVSYIASGQWADSTGSDQFGAVLVQDQQLFAARDTEKGDARPGGYGTSGGHGGVIGTAGGPGGLELSYRSMRLHTWKAKVRLTELPRKVPGIPAGEDTSRSNEVEVRSDHGGLVPGAMPSVSIVKYARWQLESHDCGPSSQVEVNARIERNLQRFPLAGFVLEGNAPFGRGDQAQQAALERAIYSGMPVVRVGRGTTQGWAAREDGSPFVSGSNLTSTKARLLLMASLLRLGAAPRAKDPIRPTAGELRRTTNYVRKLQELFDTH